MHKTVYPALNVLNNIENGIAAGVYDGELAETWTERMTMKRVVDEKEKKARGGDTVAMRTLAQWYEEGANDLPPDNKKANDWRQVAGWREMADNGDVGAMYNLGEVFRKGSHSQKRDGIESYKWYEKASDEGCVRGTAYVGFNKVYGIGTRKNVGVGLMLLMSAAKDGSDVGCFYLGKFYYFGKYGVGKNVKKAKFWLNLAVEPSAHIHMKARNIKRAREWIGEIEKEEEESSSEEEEESSSDEEMEVDSSDDEED